MKSSFSVSALAWTPGEPLPDLLLPAERGLVPLAGPGGQVLELGIDGGADGPDLLLDGPHRGVGGQELGRELRPPLLQRGQLALQVLDHPGRQGGREGVEIATPDQLVLGLELDPLHLGLGQRVGEVIELADRGVLLGAHAEDAVLRAELVELLLAPTEADLDVPQLGLEELAGLAGQRPLRGADVVPVGVGEGVGHPRGPGRAGAAVGQLDQARVPVGLRPQPREGPPDPTDGDAIDLHRLPGPRGAGPDEANPERAEGAEPGGPARGRGEGGCLGLQASDHPGSQLVAGHHPELGLPVGLEVPVPGLLSIDDVLEGQGVGAGGLELERGPGLVHRGHPRRDEDGPERDGGEDREDDREPVQDRPEPLREPLELLVVPVGIGQPVGPRHGGLGPIEAGAELGQVRGRLTGGLQRGRPAVRRFGRHGSRCPPGPESERLGNSP